MDTVFASTLEQVDVSGNWHVCPLGQSELASQQSLHRLVELQKSPAPQSVRVSTHAPP